MKFARVAIVLSICSSISCSSKSVEVDESIVDTVGSYFSSFWSTKNEAEPRKRKIQETQETATTQNHQTTETTLALDPLRVETNNTSNELASRKNKSEKSSSKELNVTKNQDLNTIFNNKVSSNENKKGNNSEVRSKQSNVNILDLTTKGNSSNSKISNEGDIPKKFGADVIPDISKKIETLPSATPLSPSHSKIEKNVPELQRSIVKSVEKTDNPYTDKNSDGIVKPTRLDDKVNNVDNSVLNKVSDYMNSFWVPSNEAEIKEKSEEIKILDQPKIYQDTVNRSNTGPSVKQGTPQLTETRLAPENVKPTTPCTHTNTEHITSTPPCTHSPSENTAPTSPCTQTTTEHITATTPCIHTTEEHITQTSPCSHTTQEHITPTTSCTHTTKEHITQTSPCTHSTKDRENKIDNKTKDAMEQSQINTATNQINTDTNQTESKENKNSTHPSDNSVKQSNSKLGESQNTTKINDTNTTTAVKSDKTNDVDHSVLEHVSDYVNSFWVPSNEAEIKPKKKEMLLVDQEINGDLRNGLDNGPEKREQAKHMTENITSTTTIGSKSNQSNQDNVTPTTHSDIAAKASNIVVHQESASAVKKGNERDKSAIKDNKVNNVDNSVLDHVSDHVNTFWVPTNEAEVKEKSKEMKTLDQQKVNKDTANRSNTGPIVKQGTPQLAETQLTPENVKTTTVCTNKIAENVKSTTPCTHSTTEHITPTTPCTHTTEKDITQTTPCTHSTKDRENKIDNKTQDAIVPSTQMNTDPDQTKSKENKNSTHPSDNSVKQSNSKLGESQNTTKINDTNTTTAVKSDKTNDVDHSVLEHVSDYVNSFWVPSNEAEIKPKKKEMLLVDQKINGDLRNGLDNGPEKREQAKHMTENFTSTTTIGSKSNQSNQDNVTPTTHSDITAKASNIVVHQESASAVKEGNEKDKSAINDNKVNNVDNSVLDHVSDHVNTFWVPTNEAEVKEKSKEMKMLDQQKVNKDTANRSNTGPIVKQGTPQLAKTQLTPENVKTTTVCTNKIAENVKSTTPCTHSTTEHITPTTPCTHTTEKDTTQTTPCTHSTKDRENKIDNKTQDAIVPSTQMNTATNQTESKENKNSTHPSDNSVKQSNSKLGESQNTTKINNTNTTTAVKSDKTNDVDHSVLEHVSDYVNSFWVPSNEAEIKPKKKETLPVDQKINGDLRNGLDNGPEKREQAKHMTENFTSTTTIGSKSNQSNQDNVTPTTHSDITAKASNIVVHQESASAVKEGNEKDKSAIKDNKVNNVDNSVLDHVSDYVNAFWVPTNEAEVKEKSKEMKTLDQQKVNKDTANRSNTGPIVKQGTPQLAETQLTPENVKTTTVCTNKIAENVKSTTPCTHSTTEHITPTTPCTHTTEKDTTQTTPCTHSTKDRENKIDNKTQDAIVPSTQMNTATNQTESKENKNSTHPSDNSVKQSNSKLGESQNTTKINNTNTTTAVKSDKTNDVDHSVLEHVSDYVNSFWVPSNEAEIKPKKKETLPVDQKINGDLRNGLDNGPEKREQAKHMTENFTSTTTIGSKSNQSNQDNVTPTTHSDITAKASNIVVHQESASAVKKGNERDKSAIKDNKVNNVDNSVLDHVSDHVNTFWVPTNEAEVKEKSKDMKTFDQQKVNKDTANRSNTGPIVKQGTPQLAETQLTPENVKTTTVCTNKIAENVKSTTPCTHSTTEHITPTTPCTHTTEKDTTQTTPCTHSTKDRENKIDNKTQDAIVPSTQMNTATNQTESKENKNSTHPSDNSVKQSNSKLGESQNTTKINNTNTTTAVKSDKTNDVDHSVLEHVSDYVNSFWVPSNEAEIKPKKKETLPVDQKINGDLRNGLDNGPEKREQAKHMTENFTSTTTIGSKSNQSNQDNVTPTTHSDITAKASNIVVHQESASAVKKGNERDKSAIKDNKVNNVDNSVLDHVSDHVNTFWVPTNEAEVKEKSKDMKTLDQQKVNKDTANRSNTGPIVKQGTPQLAETQLTPENVKTTTVCTNKIAENVKSTTPCTHSTTEHITPTTPCTHTTEKDTTQTTPCTHSTKDRENKIDNKTQDAIVPSTQMNTATNQTESKENKNSTHPSDNSVKQSNSKLGESQNTTKINNTNTTTAVKSDKTNDVDHSVLEHVSDYVNSFWVPSNEAEIKPKKKETLPVDQKINGDLRNGLDNGPEKREQAKHMTENFTSTTTIGSKSNQSNQDNVTPTTHSDITAKASNIVVHQESASAVKEGNEKDKSAINDNKVNNVDNSVLDHVSDYVNAFWVPTNEAEVKEKSKEMKTLDQQKLNQDTANRSNTGPIVKQGTPQLAETQLTPENVKTTTVCTNKIAENVKSTTPCTHSTTEHITPTTPCTHTTEKDTTQTTPCTHSTKDRENKIDNKTQDAIVPSIQMNTATNQTESKENKNSTHPSDNSVKQSNSKLGESQNTTKINNTNTTTAVKSDKTNDVDHSVLEHVSDYVNSFWVPSNEAEIKPKKKETLPVDQKINGDLRNGLDNGPEKREQAKHMTENFTSTTTIGSKSNQSNQDNVTPTTHSDITAKASNIVVHQESASAVKKGNERNKSAIKDNKVNNVDNSVLDHVSDHVNTFWVPTNEAEVKEKSKEMKTLDQQKLNQDTANRSNTGPIVKQGTPQLTETQFTPENVKSTTACTNSTTENITSTTLCTHTTTEPVISTSLCTHTTTEPGISTTPCTHTTIEHVTSTTPCTQLTTESVISTTPCNHSTTESVTSTIPCTHTTIEHVASTTPCTHTATEPGISTTPCTHTTIEHVTSTTPCTQSTTESVISTTPCTHSTTESVTSTTPCTHTTIEHVASTTPCTHTATEPGISTTPCTHTTIEHVTSTTPCSHTTIEHGKSITPYNHASIKTLTSSTPCNHTITEPVTSTTPCTHTTIDHVTTTTLCTHSTTEPVTSTTPCTHTTTKSVTSTTPYTHTTIEQDTSTTPCTQSTTESVKSTTPCTHITTESVTSTTPCTHTTIEHVTSTTPCNHTTTEPVTSTSPCTHTTTEHAVSNTKYTSSELKYSKVNMIENSVLEHASDYINSFWISSNAAEIKEKSKEIKTLDQQKQDTEKISRTGIGFNQGGHHLSYTELNPENVKTTTCKNSTTVPPTEITIPSPTTTCEHSITEPPTETTPCTHSTNVPSTKTISTTQSTTVPPTETSPTTTCTHSITVAPTETTPCTLSTTEPSTETSPTSTCTHSTTVPPIETLPTTTCTHSTIVPPTETSTTTCTHSTTRPPTETTPTTTCTHSTTVPLADTTPTTSCKHSTTKLHLVHTLLQYLLQKHRQQLLVHSLLLKILRRQHRQLLVHTLLQYHLQKQRQQLVVHTLLLNIANNYLYTLFYCTSYRNITNNYLYKLYYCTIYRNITNNYLYTIYYCTSYRIITNIYLYKLYYCTSYSKTTTNYLYKLYYCASYRIITNIYLYTLYYCTNYRNITNNYLYTLYYCTSYRIITNIYLYKLYYCMPYSNTANNYLYTFIY
ncbi:hypothetical protein M8J77_021944 [Diaphorina citri]|nr:hypothetical protein M8J77_021944 [Diaphorina citri]